MNLPLKILVGILLFLCSFMMAFAKSPTTKIRYEIVPSLASDTPKMKIGLSFQGSASGFTKIRLPLEFGGQSRLYQAIQNLRSATAKAELIDTGQPEIKIVKHKGGAAIKLEYELIQDWSGEPTAAGGASSNAGGGYRPILQPSYFHFLGSGAWVLPDLAKDAKIQISIKWAQIPANFTLANSFGTNQTAQSFSTDVEKFESSIYVGGDYKILRADVSGKPLYVATRGKWNFTDEEFVALASKVIGTAREFWNDFNHPYYLITVSPLAADANSKSIGGTGLTDSFGTFVTNNATSSEIAALLAHEYFHNWNPLAFGGMENPEQTVYWFTEGFTEYYAYRLLLNSGLIDLQDYIDKYNEFLADYYRSPARNEKNERILQDSFKDYAVYKLPYRRGMFLAAKWNEIIRRESSNAKSLDDVMRSILRDARSGKIKKISTAHIVSALSRYAAYDFASDVEKYVEKGETIGDFDKILGECSDPLIVNAGKFELGFDFETARKSKIAAQVVKESAAYAAGVREGQKILSVSVYFDQLSKPVKLKIEENGKSREISYLPETIKKITMPQFKIRENLSVNEKNRCSETISGKVSIKK